MTEEGYNGWTNYPTWNVALWLGNDQGIDNMCREMAKDVIADLSETPRADVADRLKEFVAGEEFAPDLGATMYADLLGWALGGVDWYEIADGYLEAAAEELETA